MIKLAGAAIAALAMLAFAAASVGATEPKRDAAALEDSRDQIAWHADNAKGVHRDQLRSEQQRVQDMIDALHRGEKVDPAEVDHVLNRTR